MRPTQDDDSRIIRPPPFTVPPEDDPSLDVWGFRDTSFRIEEDGEVVLTGERYPLCGWRLPYLVPWMEATCGYTMEVKDIHESHYPPQPLPSHENQGFVQELEGTLREDQWERRPEVRLRHGHGHAEDEMYAIKYGEGLKAPDLVIYPEDHDQVVAIVRAALTHDVCLVPFGGGTNVSHALRCPPSESRCIVSVDMKRMNRVLWIDSENHMACIEAGAVGRLIEAQLDEYGFTLGHEPDSIEFSTLGGWIATHASGMKKNRYGNIEDLVLDVEVVTPKGVLSREHAYPRESAGIDIRKLLLGSEGNFGIVTRATVKIFPRPEIKAYDSLLFKSLERGVGFLRQLSRGGNLPASVRLMDNLQFQFGMALRPRKTGLAAWLSKFEKAYVTKLKGFDPEKLVLCTLLFEGSQEDVRWQRRSVARAARDFGGLRGGSGNGERGYQLTFGIAYIRDFAMRHFILAESFETTIAWSDVLSMCERVRDRVLEKHAEMGLPARPFISARITQLYDTGVCVYFYLAIVYKGVEEPQKAFAELEHAAREEILRCGGSISHHHGIGKLREQYLSKVVSEDTLALKQHTKDALDPTNVFGIANQALGEKKASRSS